MQAKRNSPLSRQKPELSTGDESELFAVEIGNSPCLDLHGFDPHAAIRELDYFIDHAFAKHEEGIRIIHGIGSGSLRAATHSFLKKHPLVKAFRDAEHRNQQGGVTIVAFR